MNESDKQFLQERPDYLAIAKLADNAVEAKALRQCRVVATCDQVFNLIQTHRKLQAQVADSIINQTVDCMGGFHFPSVYY